MNKIVSTCTRCGNPIYEIQPMPTTNSGGGSVMVTVNGMPQMPLIMRTCACFSADSSSSVEDGNKKSLSIIDKLEKLLTDFSTERSNKKNGGERLLTD